MRDDASCRIHRNASKGLRRLIKGINYRIAERIGHRDDMDDFLLFDVEYFYGRRHRFRGEACPAWQHEGIKQENGAANSESVILRSGLDQFDHLG